MDLSGAGSLPMAQRTSEGVARIVREAILSGQLKPGQPLRERALAEELNISRTPIREALFILQGEGLIDLSPNRGATVRAITAHDIAHIYELRGVLEAHAARVAAENHAEPHIEEMELAYARLRRLGTQSTAAEQAHADFLFHSSISAATGIDLLHTIARQVLAVTASYRSHYTYRAAQVKTANQHHKAILDAVRDRDPDEAERMVKEHLRWSSALALDHFQVDNPASDERAGAGSAVR